MRLLLHWVLSAIAVWIVAHIVPGISVSGPMAALIAAAVIGLVNATLGLMLKILTFPLTILTLGLFWFVINALMLELAAALVKGFYVRNFIRGSHRSGHAQPGEFGVAMAGHAEPQEQLGKAFRTRTQFGEDPLNLLFGGIERAGVVDHEIGSFNFFFVGNLRCHAASYLGAGSVFRDSKAASITLNALFGMAGHDDQTVKTPGDTRFEDQGSFNDGNGIRIAPADFLHPLVLVRDHGGVDNFVEFLYPRRDARRRPARNAKCGCGQSGTIDASIGVQDLAAEAADDFLVNRAARLHERVRHGIGLDQVRAELDKHFPDDRFAARNAAGKAES